MSKQFIVTQLEQLGLDANEVIIYLHLLEYGRQTPLELSRAISIDRSKVYRSVEKLINKKLLEETHVRWGKKLQASNPGNISLLIQEEEERLGDKKQALPKLLKELSGIPTYVKREFEVKHYRGQEGLRQMLWNQLAAKKEIMAFSYKNKNDIVGKTYADKIRREQVAHKITLFEVENETDQGDYWYTDVENWGEFYKSRHISPKILDIKQYIAIFNNTVSVINWLDEEEIGLEIVNASYTEMQAQLFWKFWEIARK